MKTSRFIYDLTIYNLLFLSLLLTSCNLPDLKMHTIIHADGSCNREVSYKNIMSQEKRDSLWGEGQTGWSQPLPENLDIDAFAKSYTEVGEGDTVTTTFMCPFDNVEEMCKQTPLQLNGVRLRSKAKLDKRFRWFYTEYTFTETFYSVGDTFKLSATNYADKDVVSYWFTGQPNLVEGLSGAEASQKLDEMEPFVSKWLNDNLFMICFDYITSNYDSIANPPVSREHFIELHDSLSNYFLGDRNDNLAIHPADAFRDFFHSDAYAMFFNEDTPCGQALNKRFENCLNIFGFNVPYTLTMPGTVIDAGNGTLQPDGTVFYPFTGERLIPEDYTITATSRKVNGWSCIVSVLIIFLAIGSFLYKKRKN